jgi:hypothetical protein
MALNLLIKHTSQQYLYLKNNSYGTFINRANRLRYWITCSLSNSSVGWITGIVPSPVDDPRV